MFNFPALVDLATVTEFFEFFFVVLDRSEGFLQLKLLSVSCQLTGTRSTTCLANGRFSCVRGRAAQSLQLLQKDRKHVTCAAFEHHRAGPAAGSSARLEGHVIWRNDDPKIQVDHLLRQHVSTQSNIMQYLLCAWKTAYWPPKRPFRPICLS